MTSRIRKYGWAFALFFLIGGFGNEARSQACFQFLGDSVGCAPFRVKVRSCADPGAIVSFFFEWAPGSTDYITLPPGQTDTAYTYSNPGTYTLYQLRGGTQFVKKIVRVFSPQARPNFSWTSCQDTLKIQFSDSVFSAYRFIPGDGGSEKLINGGSTLFVYKFNFLGPKATFSFVVKGREPTTCSQDGVSDTVTLYKFNAPPAADSLIGLDTVTYRTRLKTRADEPYLIQTKSLEGWETLIDSQSQTDDPARINQISIPTITQPQLIRVATKNGCGDTLPAPSWTAIWPRVISDNQQITLMWPPVNIPDLAQFEIWRNGSRLKVINNPLDTSFVDSSGLLCGQSYCYRILIRRLVPDHAGSLVYFSAPICGQATSNSAPSPLENITATVKSNGIEINGKSPVQTTSYTLSRKEKEAGEFSILKTVSQLPFLDTDADFNNRAYCYRIQYTDKCDNFSIPSDSICPVWLRADVLNDSRVQFFWSRMEGWVDGLERYELVRTTPFDLPIYHQMGKSQSYNMEGRDKTRQRVFYTIRSYANQTDIYPTSFSNTIEIVQKSKLRFPEVFTPNDDRINDGFACANLFLVSFEMKIFNPWGELVYSTERPGDSWNGKVDSKPSPAGVYAYFSKGTDQEGNELEARGYFTLVR